VRALAVDYGRKRIGLALSDPTGLLARPWKTLPGGGAADAARHVARVVEQLLSEDDGLGVVVVGLPRRLSGEAHEQTHAVRVLVDRLQALIRVPVVLQDERLSSHEADARLARTHKDWRTRKPLLDAMAAAVILQDYLDERRGSADDVTRGFRRPSWESTDGGTGD
jgi:putative holliday junction resolvase